MGSLAAPSASALSFSLLPTASSTTLFAGGRRRRNQYCVRPRTCGAVAYMERNPNSLTGFVSRVIGSLPIVGLLARIFSDEGGIGDDLIDFAEFRRRVGKKCSITDSRAFVEFKDRRGRDQSWSISVVQPVKLVIQSGDPFYVLLCCWLAAVGAGLLKSEEILEGVARLRISNDIEFEEETFLDTMKGAREKRAKLKASSVPEIPIEVRVEKAFEAIYVCCFGKDPIEEEDRRLLCVMLNAVFPSVERSEMENIVNSMALQIAEGKRANFSELKPISKEAVQRQMKDLELLRQRSKTSS